jgi:hypothetical protein
MGIWHKYSSVAYLAVLMGVTGRCRAGAVCMAISFGRFWTRHSGAHISVHSKPDRTF